MSNPIQYPTNYLLGESKVRAFPKTQYAKIVEIIDNLNGVTGGTVKANTITESTSGSGVTITGQHITATANTATATVTLTPSQSGNTFFLAKADGIAYTLPAATTANIGVCYYFIVTTAVTSNAYSITAASASDLVKGSVITEKAGTLSPFSANGTTNYIFSMNGTTTGGLVGTVLEVVCTAANEWYLTGRNIGSGVLATSYSG